MRQLITLLIFIFFLAACKNSTTNDGKQVSANRIYFNYRIQGDENNEEVTCLLQFHNGRPEGATLELENPGKVMLDGEEINAESTPVTGAYYEVQKPLEDFVGEHNITVIDRNNKRYTEKFSFTPFTFREELPGVIPKQDLQLQLEGFSSTGQLQVIITDTAFATDDLVLTLPVENGQLVIPQQQLQKVRSGPVIMQFIKEEERPLKQATKAGGRITITYGLRREFMLAG